MSIAAEAAEVRVLLSAASIDGSGNNLSNPDWGSAGEDFIRLTVAEYADSFSSVGGEDRPRNETANSAAEISVRMTTANQITRINDRPKSPEASIVAAAGRTALATPVTSAGLNGSLLDALFSALPPGLL